MRSLVSDSQPMCIQDQICTADDIANLPNVTSSVGDQVNNGSELVSDHEFHNSLCLYC